MKIYLIDLFCGIGGFSEGARLAGAIPLLAVDNWSEALLVHEINHPGCAHWKEQLGKCTPRRFAERLRAFVRANTPPGSHIHVHGSPPCQNLSSANHMRNVEVGMGLVRWTLAVFSFLNGYTWTMEQVPNPTMLRTLSHYRHTKVNMEEYGVPQLRRRVIFHNFDLKLRKSPIPLTLKDVLDMCDMIYPPECLQLNGGLIKNSDQGYYNKPIDTVAYTVTSNQPTLYFDNKMRKLHIRVILALQTFRADYDLNNSKDLRKMIGNAVPPLMAWCIMESLFIHGAPDVTHVTQVQNGQVHRGTRGIQA